MFYKRKKKENIGFALNDRTISKSLFYSIIRFPKISWMNRDDDISYNFSSSHSAIFNILTI